MNKAQDFAGAATEDDAATRRKYIIWVVEDSDIYRMMLQRFLTKMTNADLSNKPDCEIQSFSSGEECLRMLETKKPDIIVMDYFLNGKKEKSMNGLQLLKEIKSRAPKTEVLVLSQQEDVLITAELFNLGASMYIPKEPQGENRVQNAVLETIKKLEQKKKENRRRTIALIIAFILGITIGILLLR